MGKVERERRKRGMYEGQGKRKYETKKRKGEREQNSPYQNSKLAKSPLTNCFLSKPW
jgi:hypothetical protein